MTRGASGDPLHWASETPRAPEDPFALPVRGDASMGVVRRPGEAHVVNYPPLCEPHLLPPAEPMIVVATALWSPGHPAGGLASVKAKRTVNGFTDRTPAGDEFTVNIPCPIDWSIPWRIKDPNVRTGDVFYALPTADGAWIALTDLLDAKLGTIRAFDHTAAGLACGSDWHGAPGWHLCDGTTVNGWTTRTVPVDGFLKQGSGTGGASKFTVASHADHALAHTDGGFGSYVGVCQEHSDAEAASDSHVHTIVAGALAHAETTFLPPYLGVTFLERVP